VCFKWQVRQTVQYASLHGGRVTWDATPFAFAMAIDPNAPTEVQGWHLSSPLLASQLPYEAHRCTCNKCRPACPLVVHVAH
jgi:hypothetical protein